eukprot:sb/3473711/
MERATKIFNFFLNDNDKDTKKYPSKEELAGRFARRFEESRKKGKKASGAPPKLTKQQSKRVQKRRASRSTAPMKQDSASDSLLSSVETNKDYYNVSHYSTVQRYSLKTNTNKTTVTLIKVKEWSGMDKFNNCNTAPALLQAPPSLLE